MDDGGSGHRALRDAPPGAGPHWGFQLWVNLPRADKMVPPRYQDIPAEQVPTVAGDGHTVRVLAGRFGDAVGAGDGGGDGSRTARRGPAAGCRLAVDVPSDHNAFVYAFEGAPRIGSAEVPRGHLAVLGPGDAVEVEGAGRLLLCAARPLGEPVARYGPFVMSTREELIAAFDDYRAGRLATP